MSWDYSQATNTAYASEWDSNEFGNGTKKDGYADNGFGGKDGAQDEFSAGYLVGGDGNNSGDPYGAQDQTKADYPDASGPREFSGTCRICEQQGHRASDCPNKPPIVCRNCQEEGHEAFGCERPRKINRDHVQDKTPQEAWCLIERAVDEHDLDDFKEAVEIYVKSQPEITYQEIEKKFREKSLGVYVIALSKELSPTYTNMDLQGNLDKTYSITWRWSPNPLRPKEKPFWPSSPEENLERLTDAGEPINRGIPTCSNCKTLGHIKKNCPEDPVEILDRASVLCFNCNQVGHRVRDCPEPRPDRFACKNCQKSGHTARECPEPRSAEGVECNKCHETGHFSRDCPSQPAAGGGGACHNCGQEGHRKSDCTNEAVLICRNCDAIGHMSKECPLPRDYTRVKCQNCQKMGHTKVRCTEPLTESDYGNRAEEYGNNAAQESNYSNNNYNEANDQQWGNDNSGSNAYNDEWDAGNNNVTSGAW